MADELQKAKLVGGSADLCETLDLPALLYAVQYELQYSPLSRNQAMVDVDPPVVRDTPQVLLRIGTAPFYNPPG
jgi:hypothetical protein